MTQPTIHDITWEEVQPYDHVDEGRVIIEICWWADEPGKLRATIGTPVVTHAPSLDPLDLWQLSFVDPEEREVDREDPVRVMRGIPLGPPRG